MGSLPHCNVYWSVGVSLPPIFFHLFFKHSPLRRIGRGPFSRIGLGDRTDLAEVEVSSERPSTFGRFYVSIEVGRCDIKRKQKYAQWALPTMKSIKVVPEPTTQTINRRISFFSRSRQ